VPPSVAVTPEAYPSFTRQQTHAVSPGRTPGIREAANERKGAVVYISGGVLALIVIILLLVWIF
jgi:hypothetical protein